MPPWGGRRFFFSPVQFGHSVVAPRLGGGLLRNIPPPGAPLLRNGLLDRRAGRFFSSFSFSFPFPFSFSFLFLSLFFFFFFSFLANLRCTLIYTLPHTVTPRLRQYFLFITVLPPPELRCNGDCQVNGIMIPTALWFQRHYEFNGIMESNGTMTPTALWVQRHYEFNGIIDSTELLIQRNYWFNGIIDSTELLNSTEFEIQRNSKSNGIIL